MNELLLSPEISAFIQQEWSPKNISSAFFKCTRWQQIEETMDVINCTYHYYCDSTYPGNYPPVADISALLFAAISYLSTFIFTVMELTTRRKSSSSSRTVALRRYLLPSGPISLPVTLLALANGHRINTIFPLSNLGPALLQLVRVSALAFDNSSDRSLKYALLESSTVSGILHASLYLDSVILPYYTGLDALVNSSFSGECDSCVCRRDPLVAGGRMISYRGWSPAAFSVVGVLCWRLGRGLFSGGEEEGGWVVPIGFVLEGLAWVLVAGDSVRLVSSSSPRLVVVGLLERVVNGAVGVLICLNVLRRICTLLDCCSVVFRSTRKKKKKKKKEEEEKKKKDLSLGFV